MATKSPPQITLKNGIYFPQLTETFKISKSELYDYYSTNSGMYPKNPGAGGGGGGGADLSSRVADLEESQARQDEDIESLSSVQSNIAAAAEESIALLDEGYVPAISVDEIEDLIGNQDILRKSQENLLSSF